MGQKDRETDLYQYAYVSAEVLAVPEDPEEVGDEEGSKHKNGGEQGSVRLVRLQNKQD